MYNSKESVESYTIRLFGIILSEEREKQSDFLALACLEQTRWMIIIFTDSTHELIATKQIILFEVKLLEELLAPESIFLEEHAKAL